MIFSMTGYGSSTHHNEKYTIKCEVISRNKKNFELSFNLPQFCLFAEVELKKIAQNMMKRGWITINFDIQFADKEIFINFNEELFKSWNKTIKRISKEYHLENDVKMSDWISAEYIWKPGKSSIDQDLIFKLLEKSMTDAIKKADKMRKVEGLNIKKDIIKRLDTIEKKVETIEKFRPLSISKYEQKIKDQVKTRDFSDSELNIFNKFMSVFTDKSDIAEEITRLRSHIKQFHSFISSKEAVGRSLDFMLQEFFREINTIGSKANCLEITKEVIDIKSLIEQIREQVQNVL